MPICHIRSSIFPHCREETPGRRREGQNTKYLLRKLGNIVAFLCVCVCVFWLLIVRCLTLSWRSTRGTSERRPASISRTSEPSCTGYPGLRENRCSRCLENVRCEGDIRASLGSRTHFSSTYQLNGVCSATAVREWRYLSCAFIRCKSARWPYQWLQRLLAKHPPPPPLQR